jgi:cation diffusion facilitator CzcD-associated flavoprotein CzcO
VWAADDVLHFVDEYIKAAKLDPYINYGRYVCGYEWSQAEEVWTLRVRTWPDDRVP